MALKEINNYNGKYIEDMELVFEKCQEFEKKRLDFVKEILFAIHGCLNISTDIELPKIYEEYRHTIQNADSTKDIKWWSNNFGVGMAMSWPQFEVYLIVNVICLKQLAHIKCICQKRFYLNFVLCDHYYHQEYCEEFREIVVGKTKKSTAVPESGITLVNQHKFNEELPVIMIFS